MILKIKKFLDVYAENIKKRQNIQEGVKVLVPTDKSSESNDLYVKNFDINHLKDELTDFLDEINKIRENQLKTLRKDKQKVEEKNIDFTTKYKILSNRLNIAKNDFSKINNDFNSKNRNKIYSISQTKNLQNKLKSNIEEINKKQRKLYDNLRKYSKGVDKINVTESGYDNDQKINDKTIKLKLNHFKLLKDIETLNSRFVSDKKFNFYLENLGKMIEKNLNITNIKNKKNQEILISKQIKLENLKKDIRSKYEQYDNLNKTFSKLTNINNEYNGVLKSLEDSVKLMKK